MKTYSSLKWSNIALINRQDRYEDIFEPRKEQYLKYKVIFKPGKEHSCQVGSNIANINRHVRYEDIFEPRKEQYRINKPTRPLSRHVQA